MNRLFCIAMLGFVVACGGKAAESAPPAAPATPPSSAAHGEHGSSHDDHHAKKADGPLKAPGEATVGDTTKCPVSGEEFVVEASSLKAEHGGKTYYFCCAGCKKKFESNPDKFLNKS